MTWSFSNKSDLLWNKLCIENNVNSYENLNIYANILIKKKWLTKKIVYNQNNKVISFCQIFIKKKFFTIIHIPGGIEGIVDQKIIRSLTSFLKNEYNFNSLVLINLHNNNFNIKLNPFIKMLSTYEINLIMVKNIIVNSELTSSYSKNWRHNLKRSFKYNFKISKNNNPNITELISLYNEMEIIKKKKFHFNFIQLTDYFNILSNNIIHYECRFNDRLISFRTIIFFGNNAWDFLACSNLTARKNYSNYRIVDQLLKDCIELNITNYNFGGADIKNNLGVYNYKNISITYYTL